MSMAARSGSTPAAATASRPPVTGPLRLEIAKLLGQTHVLVLGWLVVGAPVALVAALAVQSGTPSDTLFGRWVHESGLALPLVVMGFAGQWVYPVLASIVAGDIFAGEDRSGTWKLVLGRSYGRLPIFTAKTLIGLVFPVVTSAVLVTSSLVAGLLLVGRDPVVNLSGSLVAAPAGSRLVVLSFLTQIPSLLVLASFAILLSVVTRNSLVAVAGPVVAALLLQLFALVDQPPLLRQVLPSGGFTAWRGLWLDDAYTRPIGISIVSDVLLSAICLAAAAVVFARRDVSLR